MTIFLSHLSDWRDQLYYNFKPLIEPKKYAVYLFTNLIHENRIHISENFESSIILFPPKTRLNLLDEIGQQI